MGHFTVATILIGTSLLLLTAGCSDQESDQCTVDTDCPGLLVCKNGTCVDACGSHASLVCRNGDVWWFDSCGEPEELSADCSNGCKDGECISCEPDCTGRECGPDPVCATSCGVCDDPGETCSLAGQCVAECVPDCAGRECGPDPVCTTSCGECSDPGETCNQSGICGPWCTLGETRCTTDGQGFQACGPDPSQPGENTFGSHIPCAVGDSCKETTGMCDRQGCLEAEVIVLMDRSSSMLDAGTWAWVKAELLSKLDEREGHNLLGFRQFPHGGDCLVGDVLPLSRDNANAIANAMVDPDTDTTTPIEAALQSLQNQFGDSNDGQAVVLITDGDETCGTQAEAIAMAGALWRAGVRVYAIAVTTTANQAFLDLVAASGGTGASELVTSESEFESALEGFFQDLAACRCTPLETLACELRELHTCSADGRNVEITPCPEIPNGTPICIGLQCGFECNPGYLNCEGACAGCPDDAGVDVIGCEGAACVATTCLHGYHRCGATCCSWEIQTVDTFGDVGWYTSIVLDAAGNPHIGYHDFSSGDLKYARWTGDAWEIQTVDTFGDVGSYLSLALDAGDNPHIGYHDFTNGDLKYARWTGSAWDIQTVDTDGLVGWYSSLSLDSGDNPHISYYDSTNGDLKYARWTGGAWDIQTVDADDDVGWHSNLALDAADNPHISYFGYLESTDETLKYARWTGGAWDIQVVDADGDVGWYSSLALDSGDNPHISYRYRYSPDGDLKYARWTGGAWDIQTVDAGGMASLHSSIALDSGDNPHISYRYRESTDGDLKYAWWTGSAWDIQTVDAVGNVGEYSSIVLDAGDNPHISYHDYDDGALKYVH